MGLLFSIVIPVYNGEQCIVKCLNSIYNQGLKKEDFEVLCVNDASTDNTAQVISEYQKSHDNLKLITHEKNRRQGAARNTGVKAARGEYVLYVDSDDVLLLGSLLKLKKELECYKGLDILKYDSIVIKNGKVEKCIAYSDRQKVMSGREFVQKNAIPWGPCFCAFRRLFLMENSFFFKENVRFEDTDYSIACFVSAKKIKYSPILVYQYEVNDTPSTTKVGVDVNKVVEIFELNRRIGNIYQREMEKKEYDAAKVVKAHYDFGYKSMIVRYWWRLSYKDRQSLLMEYKPILPCNDKLVSFIGTYPKLFLFMSIIAKPILPVARFIYLKLKRGS